MSFLSKIPNLILFLANSLFSPLSTLLSAEGGECSPFCFRTSRTNKRRTYEARSVSEQHKRMSSSITSSGHLILRSVTHKKRVLTAQSVLCLVLLGNTPRAASSNLSVFWAKQNDLLPFPPLFSLKIVNLVSFLGQNRCQTPPKTSFHLPSCSIARGNVVSQRCL